MKICLVFLAGVFFGIISARKLGEKLLSRVKKLLALERENKELTEREVKTLRKEVQMYRDFEERANKKVSWI